MNKEIQTSTATQDEAMDATVQTQVGSFASLGVAPEILRGLEELGFAYPMPIQEAVIPFLLGNDSDAEQDLIALAQTGTGKTAAYGIPLLQCIDCNEKTTQALIVSPTRELCLQIADDLNDFGKHIPGLHVAAVYGGTGMEQQIRQLRRGVQVIVATPGRLIDLMHRDVAHIDNVKAVVLDEADEMLNMGFSEAIEEVMASVPDNARKLMFSATMSREVEKVAKKYLVNHKEIVVGSRNEGAENVNHIYYLVHAKDKYLALKRIVDYHPKIFAIIFCRTKLETQEIADKLIKDGYNAESLHGDLAQPQRDQTMQKFRQHLTQLLVATDVAARGLDVDDLTHVINYGLPDDIESYTHRSGRTGRAGKNGTSISIIHTKEKFKVKNIEKIIGKKFVDGDLPAPKDICTKQLYKAMDEIMKMDVNEEEIAPFMNEINRHFEYVDKEDLIKKIVSMTFGRFLAYYADAPEIEKPKTNAKSARNDSGEGRKTSAPRQVERGMKRLFINLGKDEGFYPGEVMQLLNRTIGGRQRVGHIDLYSHYSYIEVPEGDAENVMASLTGIHYKGREVRCNFSDDRSGSPAGRGKASVAVPSRQQKGTKAARQRKEAFGVEQFEKKSKRNNPSHKGQRGAGRFEAEGGETGDWRQFFKPQPGRKGKKLQGEEPDFSEEGWARRYPKK